MCGIVGAVARRDVTPTLLEGLKRLEYRGYDSAGLAVIDAECELDLRRSVGALNKKSWAFHSALKRIPKLSCIKLTGICSKARTC